MRAAGTSGTGLSGQRFVRWGKCVCALAAALMTAGCAQVLYEKTPAGKFAGRLNVEWIAPNLFVYRPDPAEPLTFTAADGKVIRPQLMYTDGGSIPRLFWSTPNMGPWDFAPGFIVHDWLFLQHRCKAGDWQDYSFDRSASILAEALKTQMAQSGQPDPVILWAIYEGVKTSTAKAAWDSTDCRIPPGRALPTPPGAPGAPGPMPIRILTIDIKQGGSP
jgi:hypothetical protein